MTQDWIYPLNKEEEESLIFLHTYSIEEFKRKMNIDNIFIIYNEKTNKPFMSFEGEIGAVSSKIDVTKGKKGLAISYVYSPQKERSFYLIHRELGAFKTILSL